MDAERLRREAAERRADAQGVRAESGVPARKTDRIDPDLPSKRHCARNSPTDGGNANDDNPDPRATLTRIADSAARDGKSRC